MKRLFLLLLIASTALTVSAQKDYRNSDRDDRYHYRNDHKDRCQVHKNPRKEMKRQMATINREFNTRIEYVRRHPHMRRNEKARRIEELELHRRLALDRCRDRFSGRHRDFAGDDRRFR